MKKFEEIGISSEGAEEFIRTLNEKGYTLISGVFPRGQWLYSRLKDMRLPGIQPNILETYYGCGIEKNEVGEKFIEFSDEK